MPVVLARPPAGQPAAQPAFLPLVDLGTTFLTEIGEEEYAATTHGRNLFPLTGTDRYKYVWNMQDVDELYDLRDDPVEMNNLAGDPRYASVESDLSERVRAWLKKTGDPTPDEIADLPKAGTIVFTEEAGP